LAFAVSIRHLADQRGGLRGPNWLFRFNHQRGVQRGQDSYALIVMARSRPVQL
jgi:hypothetical protein